MQEFLRLENIHKSFVGVYALKGVSFSIGRGEIHCLVGENGSGKSTLIKIISGALHPDRGEIYLEGRRLEHVESAQSIHRGIQVIYQDLALFPNLTAAENIAVSQLLARGRSLIDWKEIRAVAARAVARIQVDLDLEQVVGDLPIARQQLVAICRALTSDLRLLILDEPTASLTKREIDNLLAVVRDLQAGGISILFVSHKLSEVFEVAQRVTVLRDGESVATLPRGELTPGKLVTLMTGRAIAETRFSYSGGDRRKLMEVRGLSRRHNFQDVSFDLHAGEILGLAGLIGSGRTELALALFGIGPADRGEIRIEGRPVRIASVQDAVRAGIGYVPENRLVQGLIMKQPVGGNIVVAIIRRLLSALRLVDRKSERQTVSRWIRDLGIKVADPAVAVQTLSGGNQQRVVIAKWLATRPKILILDGPTVGIDVAAKSSIHAIIRDLAGEGMGVILISDEIPELINNCSRILLMRAGRIRAQIAAREVSTEGLQQMVEVI